MISFFQHTSVFEVSTAVGAGHLGRFHIGVSFRISLAILFIITFSVRFI